MNKVFICTNWYTDENDRDRDREELHKIGFYCIRVDYCGLEVYALQDQRNWFDKLIDKIGG